MAPINYAAQYSRELANAFPYALYYGALYATPNNGRYRMGEDGKTVYIPRLTTTGRVAANRDQIGNAARNYDNSWEPKTLSNQRKWSTLVHPKDIDQTNMATTIANITATFNEFQKFPEMDAYTISKLYALWTTTDSGIGYTGKSADTTELTASSILGVFDDMMTKMDNARVPASGRILYCTNEAKVLLQSASGITRQFDVKTASGVIRREVNRLGEVEVIGVPATLMKTKYNFDTGWAVDETASQINMFLVHPMAVITPISYQFAQLDPPSAITEGKYYYYEESFEDVFMLSQKADALQFNITPYTSA